MSDRKNAWVVDDDAEIRTALRMMLRMLGYNLTEFMDVASAAKALVSGDAPDLVLLDINMPRVSGMDLLAFIRKHALWRHLPILMVSSESTEQFVEQAITTGADGYVFKPINMDELEMAIKTAVRRRVVTSSLDLDKDADE